MFSKLINEILPRSGVFLAVFFVVMSLGYSVLYAIDFVPEPIATEEKSEETIAPSVPEITKQEEEAPEVIETGDPLPTSITIDALDRTITVLNPTSNKISDLDNALLKGVVRHPDSDDLVGPGNILILGHSSYLKNVFNKNFQAFNGIQNLNWGDTIRVKSGDVEYTYKVDRVYKAEASDVSVKTGGDEHKLTLVTCNTFGAKEDRFIVEATLVSKKAL
ncbi:hypothetical protein A2837_01585 [Candidatus Kaiserbacteria bacterium RIFCSPHIGHO2_01_FULL_46_22]|uniref:Sortase n=1 Tax=Candidatus Kaiserbacteria bacterium RIFCSPHIGHO2_01_FULL_46_22 TaxID=1798475 RepID=A0A1F6BY49_9BACT|nr:MAG: hypothetical protein A2837_01585 [Candidatus Kaiserbacteria bacterium RIFCSPHIGHO2_01_FULL_46_22]